MAFDTKQLRTCKELMKLSKIPSYIMRGGHHAIEDTIYVRFGRFYVSNAYTLVCVEWDEYQHAGDDEWQKVSQFMDNAGKLVPFEFEPCERQFANDYFERFFHRQGRLQRASTGKRAPSARRAQRVPDKRRNAHHGT